MALVRLMSEVASLLSDHDIKELIKDGKLQIDPFDIASINPASIDLRLGSVVIRYPPQTIKVGSERPKYEEIDISGKSYNLAPGEFILASTMEMVCIPDGYEGVIETKGNIARAGIQVHNNDGHIDTFQANEADTYYSQIQVHNNDGHIDAGFHGHITLEIVNINKNVHIELIPATAICQLFIGKLSSYCDSPYNGKYSNQEKPTVYYP
jgi:dCTP deaminase